MEAITTIGLDLAKNVFQAHGVGVTGNVIVRRQQRRSEVLRFFGKISPCLVGMEACSTAHHWGRDRVRLGHTGRLMPPAYVKRGKTDVADADAIAEAVTRPTMRFVALKSVDQQAVLLRHKVRDLLVRQQTMRINALRAHLAEFGMIAARGPGGAKMVIVPLQALQDTLPHAAKSALQRLADELGTIKTEIKKIEAEIIEWHRGNEASQRLAWESARGLDADRRAKPLKLPSLGGSFRGVDSHPMLAAEA